VVGWFTVASTQIDDFFGADDERLAQFISRMAGAALAREHLRQELRAGIIGAQEAERARIARDLHDELGQALTSILLGLRATQTAVAAGVADASTVSARLDRLRADTDDAVASLHRLAFELRPLVLDDLGFAAALRRLVAGIQERYDLQIEVAGGDGPGEERLPPDVETTAYRVTQEALTNILRHASAESASILMAVARGRVRVVIEDDGMGFDTSTPMDQGLGLRSMGERAALVGGTVRVTSAPGAGTAVILEIPIE
jgi:signal transduction histidine kinase